MKPSNDAVKRNLPKNALSQPAKVTIRKLPTGVRGLDDILGGGIPEFSFNIIAGKPGCGKTTMAHQIIFANATAKKPGLFLLSSANPP
jgi:circadian clock protein KaiC